MMCKSNTILGLFRKAPEQLSDREISTLIDYFGEACLWLFNEPTVTRFCNADPAFDRSRKKYSMRLPLGAGISFVIYVCPTDEFKLIQPAIVVPFEWREGSEHDFGLPRTLRNMAENIVSVVSREGDPKWSLHRAPPFASVDMSNWEEGIVTHTSGFVSLAAGLHVKRTGGIPNCRVWATGAWDHNSGIQEVCGLAEKLALADKFGVKYFFIPENQLNQFPCGNLELKGLQVGKNDFLEAIREYRLQLNCPPELNDPLERRVRWYREFDGDDAKRDAFYRRCLMPEIITRLQRELSDPPRVKHLVTIASKNPEVALTVAKTLNVQNVLVLYTHDNDGMESVAANVESSLSEAELKATKLGFRKSSMLLQQFHDIVQKCIGASDRSAIIFDITPGDKRMTLGLAALATRWDSWLAYLENAWERNRPLPEKLKVWRARNVEEI
jgi:hypothetical protein